MKCLIQSVSDEISKSHKPYCKVQLIREDKQQFQLFLWNNLDSFKDAKGKSDILEVEASWNEQFPQIQSFSISSGNPTDFIECYYASLQEAKDVLDFMLHMIYKYGGEHFEQLNNNIFSNEDILKKFLTYPAAKSMHHNMPGGLLKHTREVFDFCYNQISFVSCKAAVMLEGALLHDIGKIDEYIVEGFSTEYSASLYAGSHLARGCEYVAKYSPIEGGDIEHVKHIIMSHHFNKEWGAVQSPTTIEAFLVFCGDYLSAMQEKFERNEVDQRGIVKVGGNYLLDFNKAFDKEV